MFIETRSCEGRTPAECYVDTRSPYEVDATLPPRWGAALGGPRFCKHCTPGGVRPSHDRVSINIAPRWGAGPRPTAFL